MNYLISVLSKARLGVLIQIDMACVENEGYSFVANKVSKEMIDSCNQALSGQNEVRVSFAINHVHCFVCYSYLEKRIVFIKPIFLC